MAVSAQLRALASSYVYRRISREDCLHIDIFAYPLTYKSIDYYAIRYQFRRGGRGYDPASELIMLVKPDTDEQPIQIATNHPALTDMYLSEPVLMNGRERRAIAQWFTDYHHAHLRDIAVNYPTQAFGCKSRSIRFHYFTSPDHDPRQGFKNWYSQPVKRRR